MYKVKSRNDHNVENTNNDFEIDKFEIIEAKTKHKVALVVLYTCLLFLVCTAIYGAVNGGFNEFSAVWSNIQPILSMIVGYYLGSKNG